MLNTKSHHRRQKRKWAQDFILLVLDDTVADFSCIWSRITQVDLCSTWSQCSELTAELRSRVSWHKAETNVNPPCPYKTMEVTKQWSKNEHLSNHLKVLFEYFQQDSTQNHWIWLGVPLQILSISDRYDSLFYLANSNIFLCLWTVLLLNLVIVFYPEFSFKDDWK